MSNEFDIFLSEQFPPDAKKGTSGVFHFAMTVIVPRFMY